MIDRISGNFISNPFFFSFFLFLFYFKLNREIIKALNPARIPFKRDMSVKNRFRVYTRFVECLNENKFQ